jgi:hypoxanthine phosphoribosyltransferase
MAKQIKDEMTPYLTQEDIAKLVSKLASQIENDYEGREITFIVPLRGSVHFAADLMRKVGLMQQVDFVYAQSTEKGGAVRMTKDISINITGKDVIIIEEVIDTARTLSFLKSRLMASNPASLRIITLLDKPARRELPIRADYIGKTIEDRYVVGYGMDTEELGRNYADIYVLRN